MTHRLALSQYFNSLVFTTEIVGSFIFSFFIVFFLFLIKLNKNKNFMIGPFLYTVSALISTVFAWSFSRYISVGAQTVFFGNPLVVIAQSFFQGITKNFNGLPLINGVWYILSAQFTGTLMGTFCALMMVKLLLNFQNTEMEKQKEQNNFQKGILGKIKNIKNNSFAKQVEDVLTINTNIKYYKFAIKEFVFVLLLVFIFTTLPYLNTAAYGTTHFWNFLIMMTAVFVLLLISVNFGYFVLNLNLSIVFYIVLLIFRPYKFKQMIFMLIRIFWTITIPMLFTLFLLYIANNSDIAFNLA